MTQSKHRNVKLNWLFVVIATILTSVVIWQLIPKNKIVKTLITEQVLEREIKNSLTERGITLSSVKCETLERCVVNNFYDLASKRGSDRFIIENPLSLYSLANVFKNRSLEEGNTHFKIIMENLLDQEKRPITHGAIDMQMSLMKNSLPEQEVQKMSKLLATAIPQANLEFDVQTSTDGERTLNFSISSKISLDSVLNIGADLSGKMDFNNFLTYRTYPENKAFEFITLKNVNIYSNYDLSGERFNFLKENSSQIDEEGLKQTKDIFTAYTQAFGFKTNTIQDGLNKIEELSKDPLKGSISIKITNMEDDLLLMLGYFMKGYQEGKIGESFERYNISID